MAEQDGKKDEDKVEFDSTGEALGYISLDQAQVLAMRTARDEPGEYGADFRDVRMAYEVAEANETEDHYVVTLSFRPEGRFAGTPGQEQFYIEKEGAVAVRQVLSLPGRAWWRRSSLALGAAGIMVVGAVAVGVVFAFASGGGGDEGPTPVAAATTSTPELPGATPAPLQRKCLQQASLRRRQFRLPRCPPSLALPRPSPSLQCQRRLRRGQRARDVASGHGFRRPRLAIRRPGRTMVGSLRPLRRHRPSSGRTPVQEP